MRTIHILATAATLLVAASAPTLAAQRTYRGADAYASGAVDTSGPYYFGPRGAQGRAEAQGRTFVMPSQAAPSQYNRGQNLPYPDRPYGAPDSW